ncbi:MAG: hypothetical protein AVDCRST_MAG41-3766, partial [uncultured Corynebacteriales bacterium]
ADRRPAGTGPPHGACRPVASGGGGRGGRAGSGVRGRAARCAARPGRPHHRAAVGGAVRGAGRRVRPGRPGVADHGDGAGVAGGAADGAAAAAAAAVRGVVGAGAGGGPGGDGDRRGRGGAGGRADHRGGGTAGPRAGGRRGRLGAPLRRRPARGDGPARHRRRAPAVPGRTRAVRRSRRLRMVGGPPGVGRRGRVGPARGAVPLRTGRPTGPEFRSKIVSLL